MPLDERVCKESRHRLSQRTSGNGEARNEGPGSDAAIRCIEVAMRYEILEACTSELRNMPLTREVEFLGSPQLAGSWNKWAAQKPKY